MIHEELTLNDGLGNTGFVVIKNSKTGEILVKKHNMILKAGRNYMIKKFFDNITYDPTSSIPNIKDTDVSPITYVQPFSKIILANSSSDVSFNENTILSELARGIIDINISNSDQFSFESDENERYFCKFIVEYNNNFDEAKTETMNTIAIKMSNGKYFSRIMFDPIILNKNDAINLTYYIYF